jgi:hypothetical protein
MIIITQIKIKILHLKFLMNIKIIMIIWHYVIEFIIKYL